MSRDADYELSVLCGPSPPKDNQISGGVVGELVAARRADRKLLMALLGAVLAGIGGAGAWIYAAGQEKGDYKATIRHMQQDINELKESRGWRWLPTSDIPKP